MAQIKNRGQTQNLRRGNQPAPSEKKKEQSAQVFKKGEVNNPAGNAEALMRGQQREKLLRETAREDPERIQEELYAEMSIAALRLTKKLNRQGGEPSKLLIDALREVRQAGLVVLEIRRTRGALAEAEEFFAQMQERTNTAVDRLLSVAKPVISIPEILHDN